MSGMPSDVVGFLNLAYLSEISIVLNLAYRELKFPELHEKLVNTINNIKAQALERDTTDKIMYPEYGEILSLIDKNDNHNLWENVCFRGYFYKNFLRNQKSLKLVNINILLNVFLLILFTFFSELSFPLNVLDSCSITFYLSFFILTIMTLLPLLFIRLSTLCEFYLFDINGHRGVINDLTKKMFDRRKMILRKENMEAENFKVPR